MKRYDIAVVGGGIAGYTAALTAKNLLLDVLWLGTTPFGKLSLAAKVKNFPSQTGSGEEFVRALVRQQDAEGILFTPARVDGIYSAGGYYTVTAGKQIFEAQTVILATGVEIAGVLKGERELLGRGVSYCAVCDGALYRGKRVAAVLSGAKYAEEAEHLAKFAETVFCYCPEKLEFSEENITVLSAAPMAVLGEQRVEGLLTSEGEIPVDGVFFCRDGTPPKALCGGLAVEGDRVLVDRTMATNLSGLFAAGDITGRPYQYAKAAGEGCVAAHSARDFLRAGRPV